jgi:hypothetical protein
VLRHRLPIQDRFARVKLVKNCVSGADMVDGIVNHLECSRKKVSCVALRLLDYYYCLDDSASFDFLYSI